MRDWLGKPLLIVLMIVVVLSGLSALWLAQMPRPASGADQAATSSHTQQIQQAIRETESGR